MKFMKLGHRPETFFTMDAVRSVSSEISSDLAIQVKGTKFLLHKFPLLSKCALLQKLCSETTDAGKEIRLPDLPGGVEAFEACAKFCYGITITVSAFNIVPIRCAAEYLGMKEEVEKGNLTSKLDTFLHSCMLRRWKDAIVTLQSTRGFPILSQDLGITGCCIDAVAARVAAHPSKLKCSYSCSRGGGRDDTPYNNTDGSRHRAARKGWWAEDIAELGIDHYWRVMVAIKAATIVPANLIGEALQVYARRWLPNMTKSGIGIGIIKQVPDSCPDSTREAAAKHRLILESVVSLLPPQKGSVSCSFMLKLLKAATFLGSSYSSKLDLARRIGLQLEEANVSDLLIPSLSDADDSSLYDVDIVSIILERFMSQGQSPPTSPPRERAARERRRRSRSAENVDVEVQARRRSSASHGARLKVAKLVDGYLQVIAGDEKLPLQKVVALAEAIPDFARPAHDDLYSVIDIYLKAHPESSKSERKRLCRILDCKKLSMEACMRAAQNELLPLRVVVQVLFFEQARSAIAGGPVSELPNNLKVLLAAQGGDTGSRMVKGSAEDEWSISGLKSPRSKISTLRMKLAEAETDIDEDIINQDGAARKHAKPKFLYSMPATPKKLLSKLWSINKSVSDQKH